MRRNRICANCGGTGRIRNASERVNALERKIAELRHEISELTELYGLDLRHQTIVPGEIEARKRVARRQIELAESLEELQHAMVADGSREIVCPMCSGTGTNVADHGEMVSATSGDQLDSSNPWC